MLCCGIKTLKKVSFWVWLPLLSLFGLVWFSSPAEAAQITLNAYPVGSSATQVSLDGSNFAFEQTITQAGWFDKPYVCLRANGLSSFQTGDLLEFQFLIQTWGDNVAKLNTRLSNYNNVSGFSSVSSQVSQFSSSSGQVSVIYQALENTTLPTNTSFCIRNSGTSNTVSAFNNVVVSGGKATQYRLNSSSGGSSSGATSSDISNQTQTLSTDISNQTQTLSTGISDQTQDLINYQNNQQSDGVNNVQNNSSDATNTINSWNTSFLNAFSSLFNGLSSWFNTLTGWASPDASVGCSFDLSFLGGASSLNLCSGVPSGTLSLIHNVSSVFAFFVIIMILRSIFEDIMALIRGGTS